MLGVERRSTIASLKPETRKQKSASRGNAKMYVRVLSGDFLLNPHVNSNDILPAIQRRLEMGVPVPSDSAFFRL